MKICIIQILRKGLQSTRVALMGLGEVTTSEESQLEELRLMWGWASSKMERSAGKDETIRGIIKGVGDRVVDWI